MDSLNVYLPMDRRQAISTGGHVPEREVGAALFADISGFSGLTEDLVRRYGTRRGAEEIRAALGRVYGGLIAEVDRYHGSVIGFSGDAITCWFDGRHVNGAVAAGLAMRDAVASSRIGIKVTVALGLVRRAVVGDPAMQVYEVIAGRTVELLAAAASQTRDGEVVIASAESGAIEALTRPADRHAIEGGAWGLVTGRIDAAADPWPEMESSASSIDALKPWLPPGVAFDLTGGPIGTGAEFEAELRPGVSMFVAFSGIDYETDGADERLDVFIRGCQGVLARHEGALVDVTVGDKGSYLSIVFGAPVAHEDDATRAAAAALEIRDLSREADSIASIRIGIASGRICVGTFGGPTRRAFGVQGREVTVAARLMEVAAEAEIILSERVAREGAGRFDLRPRGSVKVKGFGDPLVISELVRARSGVPPRLHGGTPFVRRRVISSDAPRKRG